MSKYEDCLAELKSLNELKFGSPRIDNIVSYLKTFKPTIEDYENKISNLEEEVSELESKVEKIESKMELSESILKKHMRATHNKPQICDPIDLGVGDDPSDPTNNWYYIGGCGETEVSKEEYEYLKKLEEDI